MRVFKSLFYFFVWFSYVHLLLIYHMEYGIPNGGFFYKYYVIIVYKDSTF
nr:MAG TPA: hypothetical protein [Caudoviricetes sp.]